MADDLKSRAKDLVKFGVVSGCILAYLWRDSFDPNLAAFANDGPLGLMMADANRNAPLFMPRWDDLNGLGLPNAYVPPSFTVYLTWLIGPVNFIKFYPPISCWILGCSMFIFLTKLNLVRFARWFGGLAICLNSDFFSYAAWGLGTLPLCVASVLLAMSFLYEQTKTTSASV